MASGQTPDRLRSTLAGFDVKYKYRPEGWLHPLLTLAGEGIYSIRQVLVENGRSAASSRTGRATRFGWYAYGEVQPWRPLGWAASATTGPSTRSTRAASGRSSRT